MSELEGKQCRHFQCECGTEMIQVSMTEDEFPKQIFLAKFHYGTINHEYSLKERLRHCWQIIKHKSPFADDVILSIEEARRLGETLLQMTDKETCCKKEDCGCKNA